jgi:hypothetical protein
MDSDQSTRISWILFWTFWSIYILAALGTLGMLFFGFGTVHEDERQLLINSFLVETAVAIFSLFYSLFKLKQKTAKVSEVEKVVVDHEKNKEFDVFIAAPMASYSNNEEYVAARREVMKVYNALINHCQYKVYCAVANCETMEEFNSKTVSASDDIQALETSRIFIMIFPRKLFSGVIFEAGYALARHMFSVYFVSKHHDLPYMMQEISDIYPFVHAHVVAIDDGYDGIANMIRTDKHKLFKIAG